MKKIILFLFPVFVLSADDAEICSQVEKSLAAGEMESAEARIPEITSEPRRRFLTARIALLRKDKKSAETVFISIPDLPDATLEDKANAYAALLRIFTKTKEYEKLRDICIQAEKTLPENYPGKRMFLLAHARSLEAQKEFDRAREIYSAIVSSSTGESDKEWREAETIYSTILSRKDASLYTELAARNGIARILSKTGHEEMAKENLLQIFNAEKFTAEARAEAACRIAEIILEKNLLEKSKENQWIHEFLHNSAFPSERRLEVFSDLAEYYYAKGNYKNAVSYLNQGADLSELPPGQRLAILKKGLAAAKEFKKQEEAVKFMRRIFDDWRFSNEQRLEQMPDLIEYYQSKKNTEEIQKILNRAQRFRNLSRAEREKIDSFWKQAKNASR